MGRRGVGLAHTSLCTSLSIRVSDSYVRSRVEERPGAIVTLSQRRNEGRVEATLSASAAYSSFFHHHHHHFTRVFFPSFLTKHTFLKVYFQIVVPFLESIGPSPLGPNRTLSLLRNTTGLQPMARSKAAVPIRRVTSSEYTGKHDRALNGQDVSSKAANGDAQVATPETSQDSKDSSAGVVQLLICVAGIYGSL